MQTIIATVRLGYEDDRLLVPLLNTAVDKLDDLPPKSIVKMVGGCRYWWGLSLLGCELILGGAPCRLWQAGVAMAKCGG